MEDMGSLGEVLAALADPVRLEMVRRLSDAFDLVSRPGLAPHALH